MRESTGHIFISHCTDDALVVEQIRLALADF